MTSTNAGALRAYWELGKPRLSMMAVFAVVAGAYMGWPARNSHPPLDLVVMTTIGTFMAAIGAAALNMYRERDLDPLMKRTQDRPLPDIFIIFGYLQAVQGETGGLYSLSLDIFIMFGYIHFVWLYSLSLAIFIIFG